MKQTEPQTILAGVDYSGIKGSEITRVILKPYVEDPDPNEYWKRP